MIDKSAAEGVLAVREHLGDEGIEKIFDELNELKTLTLEERIRRARNAEKQK